MLTQPNPATALTVAPAQKAPQAILLHLGISLLRLQLTELLRSEVFTNEEQAAATLRIYTNEDAQQLQRWVKNVIRVKAKREAQTPLDTTNIPDAEEIEAKAAAEYVEHPALAPITEQNAPQLQRWQRSQVRQSSALTAARQAISARRYGWLSTSDYAAEMQVQQAQREFAAETGLTHSELLSL